MSQKKTADKEIYLTKANELRKKVSDYKKQRKSSLQKITKQRSEARQTLLEKLDPIINNYVKENDISLVVDKINVIMGKKDLDITKTITEKLNKELPSLNLK